VIIIVPTQLLYYYTIVSTKIVFSYTNSIYFEKYIEQYYLLHSASYKKTLYKSKNINIYTYIELFYQIQLTDK